MLERLNIAHLPTPVEELSRLSAALNGPRILVKRDDQTGLAFGGNKTRKLEYLLADAQKSGARTLVTSGAVQSNHCRQTAAAANRMGFDCLLVLTGDEPERATGNLLLDRFLGAEIIWGGGEDREQLLQQAYDQAVEDEREPYLIPYGGSNPIGAAAYAFAMQEMLDQGVEVDWIVFATSSGGTQSGLVAGGRMFDYPGHILGISVDIKASELKVEVARLAGETLLFLGEENEITPEEIMVNDDYLGEGYGIMGEREKEAMTLFARKEGLILDPVYTGRAGGGLIDLIRSGFFGTQQSVLFWHTGGSPALFAEPYWESIV